MATNWNDYGDQKPFGMFSGKFPQGLRVLIVDDNPACLRILEQKLLYFKYEVTKCDRAEKALALLRENKNSFDIVISDVQMPDFDGFQFLLQVGSEMDLPIIVMSADDSVESVIEGMKNGACDYLIKPIRLEALKTIYKHVAKRALEHMTMSNLEENAENSSSVTETNQRDLFKRKNPEGDENNNDDKDDNDHISTSKKPRVVWSVELHQQFVTAVNHLGLDKAVPKKILELMNVPWLTRENVASHLQKYRMYLKKMSDHQDNMNRSFISPREASFCAAVTSSLNGQGTTLSTTAYQGAANPSVTMAVYPRTGAAGQLQQHLSSVAQMKFLNTIPMAAIEQVGMNVPQSVHANVAANGQSRSHIITQIFSPTGQPVSSTGICSAVPGRNGLPDLPLNHDASEFSDDDFQYGNIDYNSIIGNCDPDVDDAVLENLFRDKPADTWDFQDIDFSPLPESVVSVSQELSTNRHVNAYFHGKPMIFPTSQDIENKNIEDTPHHFSEQASLLSSAAKVKPEFPDLFNSFLDQQENVSVAGTGFGLDGYSIDSKLLSF